jgi:signal transduction histidine kinase
VNVHEVVLDVVELARASALNLKRDISIDYNIDFSLSQAYVIADAQRLRQMLVC